MSNASEVFAGSIKDAENLLRHFNALNTQPPPPELEVLKRAGLIMAMTAWETYVEDRISEALSARLITVTDTHIASFLQRKLGEEISRLNNPTSQKTIQLFLDYAGVDLVDHWNWNGCDAGKVRERLDGYLKLRGEVVHRSRPIAQGAAPSHPVKKNDLGKAISFLKKLVEVTEAALT